MAATNKCLAQSNKSRAEVPATNERPAARRNFPGAANWRAPLRGQRCRSFTALWRREAARKLNMSWLHSDLYFFLFTGEQQ